VQLGQSPFLNILSESRTRATLKLMAKPPGTKVTADVARDLCQRAGAKAFVAGAIGNLGRQYVIGLDAVNCKTGDSLGEEQVTAENKELVLRALGEAATKLRAKLGESLSTVEKFDIPLDQATTPRTCTASFGISWDSISSVATCLTAVPGIRDVSKLCLRIPQKRSPESPQTHAEAKRIALFWLTTDSGHTS